MDGCPESLQDSGLHSSFAIGFYVNEPLLGTKEHVNCMFKCGFLVTTREIQSGEQFLVSYNITSPWKQADKHQLVTIARIPTQEPCEDVRKSYFNFLKAEMLSSKSDGIWKCPQGHTQAVLFPSSTM
jgi:hypothetical protein